MKNQQKSDIGEIRDTISFASFLALLGVAVSLPGCVNVGQMRSELPLDEAQIASLSPGVARADLLQRLGPPAEEGAYKGLSETVLSWRMIQPGNQHMLFNAHLDPSGRVKYYSRTIDPASAGGEGMGSGG